MLMRLCKLHEIYFTISTEPPAASMADFGFFTHCIHFESQFAFQFTIPSIFTLSVLADQSIDIKIFQVKIL